MSPFWISLELGMMEVVVTAGVVRRAKPQSKHHLQQTNTQRLTGQMSFLSSKHWREKRGLASRKNHMTGSFKQPCLWPLKARGDVGRIAKPCQPSDARASSHVFTDSRTMQRVPAGVR